MNPMNHPWGHLFRGNGFAFLGGKVIGGGRGTLGTRLIIRSHLWLDDLGMIR